MMITHPNTNPIMNGLNRSVVRLVAKKSKIIASMVIFAAFFAVFKIGPYTEERNTSNKILIKNRFGMCCHMNCGAIWSG